MRGSAIAMGGKTPQWNKRLSICCSIIAVACMECSLLTGDSGIIPAGGNQSIFAIEGEVTFQRWK
jgi:hypothetical protein